MISIKGFENNCKITEVKGDCLVLKFIVNLRSNFYVKHWSFVTDRARLIRSNFSARISCELSGNTN